MKARLVVDDAVGETRRLLLDEHDQPFRLHIARWSERGARALLGEVRWGRVKARLPGNRGWFVDLGVGPEGVVEPTQAARVTEGVMLAFRVKAEAWADKGPLLSLADMSSKVASPERPGLHAAPGADTFLGEISVTATVIGLEGRALVDGAIEEGLQTVVGLPGGGDISIETVRGATVIDIDSGSRIGASDAERSARELNLAAADMAARQLSLRGIGGLVLLDFVGMKQPDNRRAVAEHFRQKLSEYLGRSSDVLELSRLGVCEAAIARRGRPLANAVYATTPEREALEALRAIETAGIQDRGARLEAGITPAAAAWLEADTIGWRAALADRIGQRWTIAAKAGHAGRPDVRSV